MGRSHLKTIQCGWNNTILQSKKPLEGKLIFNQDQAGLGSFVPLEIK